MIKKKLKIPRITYEQYLSRCGKHRRIFHIHRNNLLRALRKLEEVDWYRISIFFDEQQKSDYYLVETKMDNKVNIF